MRALATLTAAAVGLGVLAPPSQGALASASVPKPKTGKYNGKAMTLDPSVAGAAWKPAAMKAPAAPKPLAITQTVFPAAATAEVALPGSTAGTHAGTAATPALVRAAGTPVQVGLPEAAPNLSGVAHPAAGAAPSAPAKVAVTVAGHPATVAAGVTGVVVSVSRSDGQTGPASVSVGIDYGSFDQAYGGDLPDRLKLVALPACALTTPKIPACLTQKPVAFQNDLAGKKLVATVTVPGSAPRGSVAAASSPATALVLAATSAPAGSTGSYTATSLTASNDWGEAGNTGNFAYSYPITVPPALGGTAPTVALSYDSGTVDGKTAVENAQPSWIGDGWDYSPGYIERTFVPCSKAKPTAYPTSNENCFARNASGKLLPSLTMSFGPHGGQLVHDDSDTSNTHYKLPADDGTQIDELTGSINNGSDTGEFYRVRMPDGSTAYFGADQFPADAGGTAGSGVETGSAWSEPVFNDPNKAACQDPSKVTDPSTNGADCMQVWRWNLDFLIDPHGNVTQYMYTPESNYYGRGTANKPTWYERGGVLSEIDYGWQVPDVIAANTVNPHQPAAKILFESANRCVDPAVDGGYHVNNASTGATNGAGPSGCAAAGFGSFTAGMMDTPTDQSCPSSATSCAVTSPTFWSTRRLAGITTEVAVGGAYQNVDHWDLFDQFHQLDTVTSPLWLAAIRRCAASAVGANGVCPAAVDGQANQPSLPDVQFSATIRAQRVPGVTGANVPAGLPAYQRERLGTIYDEFGATTSVQYDDPTAAGNYAPLGCTGPPTVAPDWHNTQLCYPEYWTPTGASGSFTDWFHKYVVTSITVADNTHAANVPAPTTVTAYSYGGGAAWHSNDSELLTDPNSRTYDHYRGFATVTTTKGSASDIAGHPQTQTIDTYLRGMDQDPDKAAAAAGSCDSGTLTVAKDCPPVTIADDLGGSTVDDNALTGRVLETRTLTGAGGSAWSTTVDRPWKSDPIATHTRTAPLPVLRSRQLGVAQTVTSEPLASGATQITETRTYHDEANGGRSFYVDNLAPAVADGTPEQCTATGYAVSSTKLWMISYPNSLRTISGPCLYTSPVYLGTPPAPLPGTTTGALLSGNQTYYDGGTTWPTDLSKGDATRVDALSGAVGTAGTMVMQSTAGFDGYGRTISSGNAAGAVTATAYYPANAALPSMELPAKVILAGPDPVTGQASAAWTTTTLMTQARGLATDVTDVNGRLTHVTYDALGRTAAVWNLGRPPSSPADTRYSYTVNGYPATTPGNGTIAPSVVETDTLREDNTYAVSTQLLDSLGRTRQTQSVPTSDDKGRVVTDTIYDTAGRVNVVSGPYYDSTSSPSGSAWVPVSQSAVPRATQTMYDGMSRTTDVLTLSGASELWRTHTAYVGSDRIDVTPPSGGARSSTIVDSLGKTTSLVTYHAGAAFGDTSNADVTKYGYDASGRQNLVTDASGNNWTFTFDLLGRKTASSDPDTGASAFGYNAVGNLTDSSDARVLPDGVTHQALHFTFDMLGRQTAEYNGTAANPAQLLASWAFDTVPASGSSDGHANLGRAAGSTRYTAGSTGPQYVSAVTGYDSRGHVLGATVSIPTGDGNGALGGKTYTTTNHYSALGQLQSTDLPVGGDLQPDTVGYGYDQNGLLVGSSDSYGDLASDSSYSPYGEIQRRVMGDYPSQVVQDTVYDPATRRVSNSTLSQLGWNAPVDTTAYTYNPAGQITAAVDIQGTAAGISNGLVSASTATDAQCFHYDYAGRLDAAWSDTGSVAGTTFGTMTPGSGGQNVATPAPAPVNGGIGRCANAAPTPGVTATWSVGGPEPYAQVLGYGATGNRTSETDYNTRGAVSASSTYNYNSPQPYSLQSVNHTVGSTQTTDNYAYDQAGDTTTRAVAGQPAQTLKWDPEGRLASDTDGSGAAASYVYDAAGNELMRRDATTTTLYLGATELHLELSNQQVTGDRYFAQDGGPTVVETGGSTPKLSYEAGNSQGTASTTLDAAPATADLAVTARRAHTPFNTPRGAGQPAVFGAFPDDHGFLGKSTDTSTGLVDVGARKYDPGTGRFISVDPAFQPNDPQALAGYAYADNDPVDKTDPSGLCFLGGSWCDSIQHGVTDAGAGAGHFIVKQADNVGQSFLGPILHSAGTAAADQSMLDTTGEVPSGRVDVQMPSLTDAYDDVMIRHGVNKRVMDDTSNAIDLASWVTPGIDASKAAMEADGLLPKIAAFAETYVTGCAVTSNSFLGDTPVLMADGTDKPIGDIKVCDKVANSVPGDTGRKVQQHKVTAVQITDTDVDYTTLTIKAGKGTGTITGTSHHIFYSLTADTWVPAGDLKPGDKLQTPDGSPAVVVDVHNFTQTARTYNLTIDGLHTFYVVAAGDPVLVHNDCPRGIHIAATDDNPCECDLGSRGSGEKNGQIVRTATSDVQGLEGAITRAGASVKHGPPDYDLEHANLGHEWGWFTVVLLAIKFAIPIAKNVKDVILPPGPGRHRRIDDR